ncbi:bifunctional alpha,alpha-trehalose-phosphate synthase (UDP-forming)/trehalose-phosphatase [Mucilaginibacter sp. RS28]|uniref:Alpha,alpha-trehalose-phosphate synthase n=1 Tax=Mucilaginibacter straminoryzae TaxID=2932774 RepID=A0A9X1X1X2_9SPHI|nr:bifunctional alpha,alpha-trehalose-phosphate synthase (UDP-forming)/trehalose-phosphatase [Mucilaginibacter straminoryzae]MCJ8209498.1 bifunctional alpha,alpha-trehalose-phosphate synthase (UDP-forming)/trehalose-phosphatase [Mucilaginibacter straminoryzae]
MPKVIIVSNRLPVKVSKDESGYQLSPSEGGLATGLGSIYKKDDNLWIGWPGLEVDNEDEQKQVSQQLQEISLCPVFLTQDEINRFYEGFSNEVLWPVFHYYASTYAHYHRANWEAYKRVNQKFCDMVLANAEPGDTIWVHDYQLLLLPDLIRKAMPDVAVGFFLHIPFPSHEMFRLIPWRKELLEGIIGADLIGFHTFDDVRHFLSAVTRILPVHASANILTCGERSIVIESFPMGIDDKKYDQLARSASVREESEHICETFKEQKLILSIDRLDYSKGILQRLQAFELLLETHPELHRKISLYMIVVPSRDQVPQYKELRDHIDRRVGNINARYRNIDWSPIQYFYQSFPIETLSALYSTADVCLVTPMRDGMNLVSKEYVASRVQNDGILILSEMAGASKELIDAIIVNPNNTHEVRDAIVTAINMPVEEQRRRMIQMRYNVSKFNIGHWVKIFMDRLNEAKQYQRSMQTRHVSSATKQSIINRYIKTKKRLIFLDYDGTLVDFKPNADMALPDGQLYHLLKLLAADQQNDVVLISGRKHENMDEWFGDLPVMIVAEHGAWSKPEDGDWQRITGLSNNWKQDIYQIMETYVDRTPGTLIEEKTFSLVWHYRTAPRGLGELRANELMNTLKYMLADKGLQLLPGNKVVEVKNMEISKGKASLSLSQMKNYDFIIAFGDDTTDEDMFKTLPESAVTIKVGSNLSAAKFYLRNPAEVRTLLNDFIEQHEPQEY